MAGLAEKGIEAGATFAGSRAFTAAKAGKYKRAMMWTLPLVMAGFLVWYLRK